MFTGIVAAVGRIEQVVAIGGSDAGLRLTVDAAALALDDVAVGDSIAIQGACMTVTSVAAPRFSVDVSRESLSKTVGLDRPGPVNLEKALRPTDRIGGHLVSGHVDGIATVERFEPAGESIALALRVPAALARYVAFKGSVAVDGVSLTVNRVDDEADGARIAINLIPHTLQVTTLGRLRAGDRVNVEIDTIARYVERMMQRVCVPVTGWDSQGKLAPDR